MLSGIGMEQLRKRGRANLRPVLFGSRFRRRLFRRVHFLRRIPPSLSVPSSVRIALSSSRRRRSNSSLRLSPHRRAHQAQSSRRQLSSACSSSPSEWPRFFATPRFLPGSALAHFFSLSLMAFSGLRWPVGSIATVHSAANPRNRHLERLPPRLRGSPSGGRPASAPSSHVLLSPPQAHHRPRSSPRRPAKSGAWRRSEATPRATRSTPTIMPARRLSLMSAPMR